MPLRERKNIRLKNWDYRRDGMYFITICTRDRTHFFGEIKNGKMIHSPAGAIANVLWNDIPRNSDTIDLGEFVIMPDHMHGIIILSGNQTSDPSGGRCMQRPHGPNNPNSTTCPSKIFSHFTQTQFDFYHYPVLQISCHQTLQQVGN